MIGLNLLAMKNNLKIVLSKCISLASFKFVDVYDKSGEPYILHCLYVMRKVRYKGTSAMIVAILHDILEDTDVTEQDLIDLGVPNDLILSVKLLTKSKSVAYSDYIEAVKKNEIAKIVKLADLEHNMKLNRLKGLSEKDLERMHKYSLAYRFLNN